MWSIARANGLTVDELKKINNLNSNMLSVGQKLKLNGNPVNANVVIYTVKSGDTLYTIANKYGVSVNDLKDANQLENNIISINQQLNIPNNNNYDIYTVKSGDTLYSIANKFGTTVDILKNINNIVTDILSIGQKLLIP